MDTSKPPTQTHKFLTLNKLILSYFHNIVHLIDQLSDQEMIELAIAESAKLLPYVVGSRKTVKTYLRVPFFRFGRELLTNASIDVFGTLVLRAGPGQDSCIPRSATFGFLDRRGYHGLGAEGVLCLSATSTQLSSVGREYTLLL
jgi:hypothetical protein